MRIAIVGGGLTGPLMAIHLGRMGHEVEVFERRSDPRRGAAEAGRSINLALSTRGLHALEQAGLAEKMLEIAIPMKGRMVHSRESSLRFQAYGTRESEVINSVSRGALNAALLEAAERTPSVRLIFGARCTGLDLDSGTATFLETGTGRTLTSSGDFVIGADGAFSAVRLAMQKADGFDYQQSYLTHGYKELVIPPAAGGGHRLERNALHIWPRESSMMIALPNRDGSFTCTCFWPIRGRGSFEALTTREKVIRRFREEYPDAEPLMPTLSEDYFGNPVGSLVTIRCTPWHHRDRAALLGDACHAVVPFYGQGANAGFEDCEVLAECLARHPSDRGRAFALYESLRKRHTDALADLSLANFVEMRDRTASRVFLAGKRLEKALHRLFPTRFIPLYTMVTFCRIPYADAVAKAKRQALAVSASAAGFLLFTLLLLLRALRWI